MKQSMITLSLTILGFVSSFAQTSNMATYTKEEKGLINLSKDKWQWMADKNMEKLAALFHDKSKFVHMIATWKKAEELEIIETGRIWYKNASGHDTAVEIVTMRLLSGIVLR